MYESPNLEGPRLRRPGGPLPESHLFDLKVVKTSSGLKQYGVTTPRGRFYPFLKGETFSLVREEKGKDRQPFIVRTNGVNIRFEDWVRELEVQAAQKKPIWGYDRNAKSILDPSGNKRQLDSLSLEELRTICIEIRNEPTSVDVRSSWPSDVAERITERYLNVLRVREADKSD